MEAWRNFKSGNWCEEIDVRDFIINNYTPYEGDSSFLEGPTGDTTRLWGQVSDLLTKERESGGVLDVDTKIISTMTSHDPGYINKDLEKIVGLQTDQPLKRGIMPLAESEW